MNYPGLFTPILLALLAVLSLSLAWKQERFPEWLRVFLMLAGLILLVMATFAVIDLLADRYATYQSRMYAAQARTEAVLKLEAFARLTSEQATFFMASAANILMVMDNGLATEFVFRWMNQEIPLHLWRHSSTRVGVTIYARCGTTPKERTSANGRGF